MKSTFLPHEKESILAALDLKKVRLEMVEYIMEINRLPEFVTISSGWEAGGPCRPYITFLSSVGVDELIEDDVGLINDNEGRRWFDWNAVEMSIGKYGFQYTAWLTPEDYGGPVDDIWRPAAKTLCRVLLSY